MDDQSCDEPAASVASVASVAEDTTPLAKFCHAFGTFIGDLVNAHESGMYKFFVITAGNHLAALRFSHVMIPIIAKRAEDYWNTTYNGLADPEVALSPDETIYVNAFRDLLALLPAHSPVCLINIAFRCYLNLHTSLERSLFDVTSYELYMASVVAQVKIGVKILQQKKLFDHECRGRPIEKIPPGKQMFYAVIGETDSCAGCKKPRAMLDELKRCSGCKKVQYCSTECQRNHRKVHRADCNRVKK